MYRRHYSMQLTADLDTVGEALRLPGNRLPSQILNRYIVESRKVVPTPLPASLTKSCRLSCERCAGLW